MIETLLLIFLACLLGAGITLVISLTCILVVAAIKAIKILRDMK